MLKHAIHIHFDTGNLVLCEESILITIRESVAILDGRTGTIGVVGPDDRVHQFDPTGRNVSKRDLTEQGRTHVKFARGYVCR